MGIDVGAIDKRINEIKLHVESKLTHYFQAIALQTFNYVSANATNVSGYGSPVLTGRFYSSHTISVNFIDHATQPVNPQGASKPYSGIPQSIASGKVQTAKLGDKIYIANSLDYAHKLEYQAHSPKAPDGIYRVAAQLVSMKFKDVGLSL